MSRIESIEDKYKRYKYRTGLYIDFKTFTKPVEMIEIHANNIGTVLKKINKNLACYEHIEYFGCMLFFSDLTEDQINNGPIVWEDTGGVSCL